VLTHSYKHAAGDNTALVPETIPSHPDVGYSHANVNDFDGFDNAASIAEVRFYCTTNNHGRVIHFKSYDNTIAQMTFVDGDQTSNAAIELVDRLEYNHNSGWWRKCQFAELY
jgi:hypothetical protein